MAFSRSTLPDIDGEIRGRQVYLRQPTMSDYSAWAELRALSRQHLTVWEPMWARDELSRSAFRRRLRQYSREMRDDQGYAYLIYLEGDGRLLGGLTISNVRRGVAQSAAIGYWMGLPHSGRGYMTDAVRATIPFAFETLALHRLEAACLPHNTNSSRVLMKCGFRREGTARRYLKINDMWQDHDLYAILHDDPRT